MRTSFQANESTAIVFRNRKEFSMHPSRIRAAGLAVFLCLGAAALLFAEGAQQKAVAKVAKKVNINTASEVELAYLPRLGAKVAVRIVEHRKQKPFARPEELMEVKGIGEKLFVTLKPYVAVNGPTTLTAKVRSSSSSSASRPSSPPAAPKEKPATTVPVGKGR
jgi:competence protein ComEA